MTTLKDMPMISVEQKNRFREAALEVEKERDALAAWLDECLSAMRYASEFLDESDKGAELALRRMDILSSRSRRLADSLARRDARMKAEALEGVLYEYLDENIDMVEGQDIRDDLAKYRQQAEEMGDG